MDFDRRGLSNLSGVMCGKMMKVSVTIASMPCWPPSRMQICLNACLERQMWHFFDRITNGIGALAAWVFFVIGLIVTFEVVMRYAFNSPTIWVDEISRILQIWATCLAAGYALRHRALIVIDVIFLIPIGLGAKFVKRLLFW